MTTPRSLWYRRPHLPPRDSLALAPVCRSEEMEWSSNNNNNNAARSNGGRGSCCSVTCVSEAHTVSEWECDASFWLCHCGVRRNWLTFDWDIDFKTTSSNKLEKFLGFLGDYLCHLRTLSHLYYSCTAAPERDLAAAVDLNSFVLMRLEIIWETLSKQEFLCGLSFCFG